LFVQFAPRCHSVRTQYIAGIQLASSKDADCQPSLSVFAQRQVPSETIASFSPFVKSTSNMQRKPAGFFVTVEGRFSTVITSKLVPILSSFATSLKWRPFFQSVAEPSVSPFSAAETELSAVTNRRRSQLFCQLVARNTFEETAFPSVHLEQDFLLETKSTEHDQDAVRIHQRTRPTQDVG